MVRCDPDCWACIELEKVFKDGKCCLECAIKELRRLGYSYEQISFMLHTSERTIAKVEKGEEIDGRLIDFGHMIS
ncbi:MAG: hypothetical protein ABSF09_05635 [Candidatus Bathyarchaeia archaeon]